MNVASSFQLKRPFWQNLVMLTLGLWVGGSLVLDWVILPSLYVSGMMTSPGFTTAGYLIFWNYNRIELLAAALVLTGVLVLGRTEFSTPKWRSIAVVLSLLLLSISLMDTYFLTPNMCAAGIQLNIFEAVKEIPATMKQLHAGYWLLEAVKLFSAGTLLSLCFRQET